MAPPKRTRLRWALAILLVSGALVTLFIRNFEARHYASAVLEVKPFAGMRYGTNDNSVILADVTVVYSPPILKAAVRSLRLDKEWSTPDETLTAAEAEARLRDVIAISIVHDHGLVELGAWDRDPQRAAEIANTVAFLYKDSRLDEQQDRIDKEFSDLKRRALTTKVEMARELENLMRLAARNQIHDPDRDDAESQPRFAPASDDSAGGGFDADSVPQAYREAKTRYLTARKMANGAEMVLRSVMVTISCGNEPVTIWQKAEPYPVERWEASGSTLQRWRQRILRAFSRKARNL